MNPRDEIRWGRRVPKWMLHRLYTSDSLGLLDEALLDEVGSLLLERCRDILKVKDAQQGHIHCARCDRQGVTTFIERPRPLGDPREALLVCPGCGWQITWGEYHLSFKRRQLNPGGATEIFAAFVADYPQSRTPQAKMLAIDRLIHAFHYSYVSLPDQPTRPVGVNLIEGHLEDVIAFLDGLTFGAAPEMAEAWRKNLAEFRYANDRIRAVIQQRKGSGKERESPPV